MTQEDQVYRRYKNWEMEWWKWLTEFARIRRKWEKGKHMAMLQLHSGFGWQDRNVHLDKTTTNTNWEPNKELKGIIALKEYRKEVSEYFIDHLHRMKKDA